MHPNEKDCVKGCVSLVLRLAVASLFIGTSVGKFQAGLGQLVPSFQAMFQGTWLPLPLVTLYARLIPWVEVLIPLWLLSGIRLKSAWFFTALFMISLGFGMVVAKSPVAASNYMYVLLCCAGLLFSPYDCFRLGHCGDQQASDEGHGTACPR